MMGYVLEAVMVHRAVTPVGDRSMWSCLFVCCKTNQSTVLEFSCKTCMHRKHLQHEHDTHTQVTRFNIMLATSIRYANVSGLFLWSFAITHQFTQFSIGCHRSSLTFATIRADPRAHSAVCAECTIKIMLGCHGYVYIYIYIYREREIHIHIHMFIIVI